VGAWLLVVSVPERQHGILSQARSTSEIPIRRKAIKMQSQTNMQQDSSMLNWFPKIKDILPVPKTEILEISKDEMFEIIGLLDEEMISEDLFKKIKESANRIGYPLFMRSDQGSAKHDYEHSCHVPAEDALLGNLACLFEWHLMVDLWPAAIVFRELLPLYSDFTAFRGLPIAKERRYFVDEGKVVCHHPYWPEGAIEHPRHENWVSHLEDMNIESDEEISHLSEMAIKFAEAVPGCYSVDFAMTEDRTWYMIDAARGELSYHPEHKEV
jgi:hypothetical protein